MSLQGQESRSERTNPHSDLSVLAYVGHRIKPTRPHDWCEPRHVRYGAGGDERRFCGCGGLSETNRSGWAFGGGPWWYLIPSAIGGRTGWELIVSLRVGRCRLPFKGREDLRSVLNAVG